MKRSRGIVAAVLTAAIMTAWFPVHAEPALPERKMARSGFYEGTLLMSAHGGAVIDASGSLIAHDRGVTSADQIAVLTGSQPFRLAGGPPVTAAFFSGPRFDGGQQGFLDFEYGVTSRLGAGIAYGSGSLSVTRQEVLPQPATLASAGGPVPYLEALPMHRTYYSDNSVLGLVSFHFLPERRLDPYVIARVGAATTHTAYRGSYDYFGRMLQPDTSGVAWVAGAGLGMNVHLTAEFGLKVEASTTQRYVHSEAFAREKINMAAVTAGIVFNWDNISRFSY